jgi:hypothetical protein
VQQVQESANEYTQQTKKQQIHISFTFSFISFIFFFQGCTLSLAVDGAIYSL